MTLEERKNDPPGTIVEFINSLNGRCHYFKVGDNYWLSQYGEDYSDANVWACTLVYRPIAVGDIITSDQTKTLLAGSITKVNSSWSDQHQLKLDDGYYWYAGPNGGNNRSFQPLGSNSNEYVVIYINHSK